MPRPMMPSPINPICFASASMFDLEAILSLFNCRLFLCQQGSACTVAEADELGRCAKYDVY